MPELAFAVAILPGKLEEWLRFVQTLEGGRRQEYEESRRRHGIRRERVWLTQVQRKYVAVVVADVEAPAQVVSKLASSPRPFDRWFTRRIRELHGLDIEQVSDSAAGELVFDWHDRRTITDDGVDGQKGGE